MVQGSLLPSVARSANQILENALTSELSSQAALKEAQVYMSSIEDLFSEDSDDSLNTLLDAYWSAWEDLSNNPSGETEQNAVYDAGLALTGRINAIEEALSDLTDGLDSEISSAVTEVNSISEQIAGVKTWPSLPAKVPAGMPMTLRMNETHWWTILENALILM